ncbi:MAG: hypothetical protein C4308_12495 [Chitinophagaceae bacterium]
MQKLILLPAVIAFIACNNSNKPFANEVKSASQQRNTATTTESKEAMKTTTGSASTKISIDGKDISLGGSALVSKDKDKLQPGGTVFLYADFHRRPKPGIADTEFCF